MQQGMPCPLHYTLCFSLKGSGYHTAIPTEPPAATLSAVRAVGKERQPGLLPLSYERLPHSFQKPSTRLPIQPHCHSVLAGRSWWSGTPVGAILSAGPACWETVWPITSPHFFQGHRSSTVILHLKYEILLKKEFSFKSLNLCKAWRRLN